MYNLLFVDDDVLIVKKIQDILDWKRLSINLPFIAYSYEQAVGVFAREPIHIMISDIEMLGHSGMELLEWTRRNHPQTLCSFLTCHSRFEYAQHAIQLGVQRYLLKPINMRELEELLSDCVMMLNNMGRPAPASSETGWSDIVQLTVSYIQQNLAEPLNRESISRELFVSYKTLSRLFNREVGMSISEYIIGLRMQWACDLLSSTNLKITEICDQIGYNYHSYFTKAFYKRTGKTPQQFRSESQEHLSP